MPPGAEASNSGHLHHSREWSLEAHPASRGTRSGLASGSHRLGWGSLAPEKEVKKENHTLPLLGAMAYLIYPPRARGTRRQSFLAGTWLMTMLMNM